MKLVRLFFLLSIVTTSVAEAYVGSGQCGTCHEDKYDLWSEGGHHYSLTCIDSVGSPQYPYSYHTGQANVPAPPTVAGNPLNWPDISYVVGGFYRSAIFTDSDGYLITGQSADETQWDVWNEEWKSYYPGQQIELDCSSCHATGYDPEGHQGGLPGIAGTWAEDGVGCEACHGPGS